MTTNEPPRRSAARAHLTQLIDMFGTDGCLRVSTSSADDTGDWASDDGPDRDEPDHEEKTCLGLLPRLCPGARLA